MIFFSEIQQYVKEIVRDAESGDTEAQVECYGIGKIRP